jgi:site-specific DNA-cytosine methylase
MEATFKTQIDERFNEDKTLNQLFSKYDFKNEKSVASYSEYMQGCANLSFDGTLYSLTAGRPEYTISEEEATRHDGDPVHMYECRPFTDKECLRQNTLFIGTREELKRFISTTPTGWESIDSYVESL